MTTIEAVAVVFGLLSVGFTIRQSIWCWPTGLIQVFLYLLIFYEVKLYSDLILHVIYVMLQGYGWYHWLHGGTDSGRLAVSRLSHYGLVGWIVVVIAGTGVWGFVMASYTDASLPFWDAFTTVASLVAQWLMTRKRLESWLVWIAVDVVAIGVYLSKALVLTSVLYAVFLVMAVMGLLAWKNSMAVRSKG
ncbi:nicotinamide riboside transporter PnuC [Tautonia marina]|uniref:nicotinamide riboside transporter PnuC n=1 Tax=Tautonia marina TaxID=2653855 RepID=UPI0012612DEB|nr:nicotinamide riboside transporter PnuC [Tautonia marina]